MKISILVDQPMGWIVPWALQLRERLIQLDHDVLVVNSQEELPEGDVSFFLGCTKIVKEQYLARNGMNIVVHPSKLPAGRGFSPLAWQVLEGSNEIPVSLFMATNKVDDGLIYLRDVIKLNGSELNEEIKEKQGATILRMCLYFVKNFSSLHPKPQVGVPTYYKRRTAQDSQLNIDMTLRSQFLLLRIVDNERYPAFFILNGKKYILKIEKAAE